MGVGMNDKSNNKVIVIGDKKGAPFTGD